MKKYVYRIIPAIVIFFIIGNVYAASSDDFGGLLQSGLAMLILMIIMKIQVTL